MHAPMKTYRLFFLMMLSLVCLALPGAIWSRAVPHADEPDLSASSKVAEPTAAGYFQDVTYTITLRNEGDFGASVTITDTPPLPYEDGSASGGLWWDATAGALRWQGEVASGAERVLSFVVSGPTPIIAHNSMMVNDVVIDDGVHAPFVRSAKVVVNPTGTPTPTPTFTVSPTPTFTVTPTPTATVAATPPTPAEGPFLSVSGRTYVQTGHSITLPVYFGGRGHLIAGVHFSLDYDSSVLSYSGAGFAVPGDFRTQITHDAGDNEGELEFIIADEQPPLAALPDGSVAYVTFLAGTPDMGHFQETRLDFAPAPPVLFRNTAGQTVNGVVQGGEIVVWPGTPTPTSTPHPLPQKLWLPLLWR